MLSIQLVWGIPCRWSGALLQKGLVSRSGKRKDSKAKSELFGMVPINGLIVLIFVSQQEL